MVRTKAFTILLVLAAVVLSGLLIVALACGRQRRSMMGPGGRQMTEPEAHMHEEEAGEHEHAGAERAVASSQEIPLEPSGSVQDGVRVVQVKARRFQFEPSTIVVRHGETVRLEVTSQDVTHGMGIKDFDINVTLPPGEPQTVTFTVGEAGSHHVHCSVFCGPGHSQMHGEIVVLE